MKNGSLIVIILFFSIQSANAQLKDTTRRPTNHELATQYLQKSKSLRTTGFILLGAGVAAWTIGAIEFNENYDILTGEGYGWLALAGAGIGSTATGIVLLINGHRYKDKANFILQNERPGNTYHMPIKGNLASLGIVIHFK